MQIKSTLNPPASTREHTPRPRITTSSDSPRNDAPTLTGMFARSKAPDLDRRLSRTPTQYRAHLASENDFPHRFARCGDIAEVDAGAYIEETHATVVPARDEELLVELQRCD